MPGVFTPYAAFVTAKDIFGAKTEEVEAATRANLRAWAETVASASSHVGSDAIESLFRHQHDLIFKDKVAIGEITMTSSTKIASEFWTLLPFSRGSVHLLSKITNETSRFEVNPRFFQVDFDEQSFIALSRLTQKFWATSPAAEQVTGKIDPTADQIPTGATDDAWKSYIRNTVVPNCHMLGTAAMMARELDGVVDEELRVYGTENVRVVDASVIPIQVTGHLISTIYAVAARAADIIVGAKQNSRKQ